MAEVSPLSGSTGPAAPGPEGAGVPPLAGGSGIGESRNAQGAMIP